ncbi:PREDICTED: uncharacterized protein LOC108359841 [Rhagoletis zephyria]|uniref:uncharacterized protein LOC108359841 n=1 Tax=Rhagoletis zephyria TaxID=28612 RepID=UPI0008114687|nr:PREDICTED: uncharacterized protein LOC108359841 [Rhagoletis zephyria]
MLIVHLEDRFPNFLDDWRFERLIQGIKKEILRCCLAATLILLNHGLKYVMYPVKNSISVSFFVDFMKTRTTMDSAIATNMYSPWARCWRIAATQPYTYSMLLRAFAKFLAPANF